MKMKFGNPRNVVPAYIEAVKKFNAASRREAGSQLTTIDMLNDMAGVKIEKAWSADGNHITAIKHNGQTYTLADYPDHENRLYQQGDVLFGVTLAKGEKVVGMKLYTAPNLRRKVIRLEIRRTLRSTEGWLDQPVPASDTNYFAKIMDDLEHNAELVAVRPIYHNELVLYYAEMTRETQWVLGMAPEEPAAAKAMSSAAAPADATTLQSATDTALPWEPHPHGVAGAPESLDAEDVIHSMGEYHTDPEQPSSTETFDFAALQTSEICAAMGRHADSIREGNQ